MDYLNKEIFSLYLIPGWNKPTIAKQICFITTPGTWVTYLEVLATATVCQFTTIHKIHKGLQMECSKTCQFN